MIVAVMQVVLTRPGDLDRRPVHRLRAKARLHDEVGLGFPPDPPPSRVRLTFTFSTGRPRRFARRARVTCGACVQAQASADPFTMRTSAAGGSIGDWAR